MRRRTILLWLSGIVACGGSSPLRLPLAGGDGGTVLIGSPCLPDVENDPTFTGFSRSETTIQSFAGQPPGAPVCLVIDFQGRVSCPYGQDVSDAGLGGTACKTPDGVPVTAAVAPQCVDIRPLDHVVWSCRCSGPGPSSSTCECPSGMACLSGPFAAGPANADDSLAGGYCVPSALVSGPQACAATCDPAAHPCD